MLDIDEEHTAYDKQHNLKQLVDNTENIEVNAFHTFGNQLGKTSSALQFISYLGQLGGAEGGRRDPSSIVTYLTALFHGIFPWEKLGVRTTREMRTLAEASDLLGSANLTRTADLLV